MQVCQWLWISMAVLCLFVQAYLLGYCYGLGWALRVMREERSETE